MKILIDECVPRPITKLLAGHDVLSTNHLGIIQDNAIRIIAAVQAIQPADFVELALPWVK